MPSFPLHTADPIRAVVDLADLVEPVADAFTAFSTGEGTRAPVMVLPVADSGDSHVKAAHLPRGRHSLGSLGYARVVGRQSRLRSSLGGGPAVGWSGATPHRWRSRGMTALIPVEAPSPGAGLFVPRFQRRHRGGIMAA
ncbi:hypothetical protein ACFW5D_28345 [Streptomyces sp. NPDC058770]|uniref:hypothetical protein n=1 Tax=Streptomyces sp. NPDC058770 TaxID=3346631 RepID=UPI00369DE532